MTDTPQGLRASEASTGTAGQEPYPGSQPDAKPPSGLGPAAWAKANLFNNALNSVITVVLGILIVFLTFQVVRWVLTIAEWAPVQRNLTLFMIGQFPRDEQWRLVASMVLIATAIGAAAGLLSASTVRRAREDELEHEPASPWSVVRRFWPALAFVVVLLVASRTAGPFLVAGGALAAGSAAWILGRFVMGRVPRLGWGVMAVLALASFQVVSGTGGNAHLGVGVIFAYWLTVGVDAAAGARDIGGLPLTAAKAGAAAAGLVVAWGLYQLPLLDFGGVSWAEWGGLHLSLFVTAVCIVLAFPIGLLLALGRRSSLPVLRWLSISYIEVFRGVPLISILLMAQFFIGFFLGSGNTRSLITRVIIGITMFTVAYIAEIVRGGLEAVPAGQVEAGQALGLPPQKVTRLIVLPQALRAVIPAMVGQFISLFKDTSLLVIVGLTEFLGVRELVHAQADFRIGFQEMTLVFIAFGYWAISYTMSRESRRLEARLGVGVR